MECEDQEHSCITTVTSTLAEQRPGNDSTVLCIVGRHVPGIEANHMVDFKKAHQHMCSCACVCVEGGRGRGLCMAPSAVCKLTFT